MKDRCFYSTARKASVSVKAVTGGNAGNESVEHRKNPLPIEEFSHRSLESTEIVLTIPTHFFF